MRFLVVSRNFDSNNGKASPFSIFLAAPGSTGPLHLSISISPQHASIMHVQYQRKTLHPPIGSFEEVIEATVESNVHEIGLFNQNFSFAVRGVSSRLIGT